MLNKVHNLTKKILFFIVFLLFFCSNPCLAIKIGLLENADAVKIGSSKKAYLIDIQTGNRLWTMDSMKYYEFKPYRNEITIKFNNTTYKTKSDKLLIKLGSDSGFLCVKNRWYRGDIILIKANDGLTVVNDVSLEDYLKGVVPSEMPPGWNIEAHKAQAIAARSYAIANLGKRASFGYDLKDTPEDQAYGGASVETSKTNNAVSQTKGIVITYNKKVIPAFYCASAGGKTVNSADVWMKNLPFLQSVPSFDDDVSKNGHGVGMSQHGANNLAQQGYNAFQILNYFYSNTRFGKLDSSWKI